MRFFLHLGVLFLLLINGLTGHAQFFCGGLDLDPNPDNFVSHVAVNAGGSLDETYFGPGNSYGISNYRDQYDNPSTYLYLERGATHSLSIEYDFVPGREFYATAYIDYDENGTVDDMIDMGIFGPSYNGTFSIPPFTGLGSALLRIVLSEDLEGHPCGVTPIPTRYGSVHDYRIMVICKPSTNGSPDFISQVDFQGSRDHLFTHSNSGVGNQGTENYENHFNNTAYTGDVFTGEDNQIAVTFSGEVGTTYYGTVLLDHGSDGTFEYSHSLGSITMPSQPFEIVFNGTIPINAFAELGAARMRVIISASPAPSHPCDGGSRGEIHDYRLNVRCPTYEYDYTYHGNSQPANIQVYPGTNQVPVLKMKFSADDGCENVERLIEFTFDAGGTTTLANIDLFHIHRSNVDDFDNAPIIFSDFPDVIMDYYANGYTLPDGDTYFWISYDVAEDAQVGNRLDAKIQTIQFEDNDNPPSFQQLLTNGPANPAGEQVISYPLCIPSNLVDNARLKTIQFDGSGFNTFFFTGNFQLNENDTLDLLGGDLTTVSAYFEDGPATTSASLARMFIDWNFDNDFDDDNETIDLGYVQEGSTNQFIPASFQVPADAKPGINIMRIATGPADGNWDACSSGIGTISDLPVRICAVGIASVESFICTPADATFSISNYQGPGEWQIFNEGTGMWDNSGDTDGFFKISNIAETKRVRYSMDLSEMGCPAGFSNSAYGSYPGLPEFVNFDAGDPCLGTPAHLEVTYDYAEVDFIDSAITPLNDGNTDGSAGVTISNSIAVSGVKPGKMNPMVLDQVCFKLKHPNYDQLRVSLVNTGVVELRLFDFGDLSGNDSAITCFSNNGIALAQQPTREEFRFSEGISKLNGLNSNGNWHLQIEDKTTGASGELLEWSLDFGSFSNTWTPATGLSTTLGDQTNASPNESTTYTANISNGICTLRNSKALNYFVPNITLDKLPNGSIALCSGGSTFTATVENEQVGLYQYEWFLNNVSQGFGGLSHVIPGVVDGDVIRVDLTYPGCTNTYSDAANAVVYPNLDPSFTFATDFEWRTTCLGSDVEFYIQPQDSGTAPTYTWFLNGDTLFEGDTLLNYTAGLIPQNALLEVRMDVVDPCSSAEYFAFDTLLIFSDTANIDMQLTSNLRGDSICAGEALDFEVIFGETANSNSELTWFLNDQPLNHNHFRLLLDSLGGQSSYKLTTWIKNGVCATPDSIADSLEFYVAPVSDSYVKIESVAPAYCEQATAQFQVTDFSGYSSNYSFKWYVGDLLIPSETGDLANINFLEDGETIRCELVSDFGCVEQVMLDSAQVNVTILPTITSSFEIVTDGLMACEGDDVQFMEFNSQGRGVGAIFTWYKNNAQVSTGVADSIIIPGLVSGDKVYGVMQSGHPCASPAFATSEEIVLDFIPSVTPSANLVSNDIDVCDGASPKLTLENDQNLGFNPDIHWIVNMDTIIGFNNLFYTLEDMEPGDYTVSAEIVSKERCAVPETFTTNSTEIHIHENPDALFDYSLTGDGYLFETREIDALSWSWNIGGIFSSTDPNPRFYTSSDTVLTACQTVQNTFGCESEYCETISMVSIADENAPNMATFELFPNPAHETLTFSSDKTGVLSIYNAVGQLIRQIAVVQPENNKTINVASFPEGVYSVEWTSEMKRQVKRITILH